MEPVHFVWACKAVLSMNCNAAGELINADNEMFPLINTMSRLNIAA